MNKFCFRLFFLTSIVVLISVAVIYFTVDIDTLLHLSDFRPWSLGVALICAAIGLLFDSTRLMKLVKISGEDISLGDSIKVIFGNYFLALLTPGATGGALAQVMFLRKAGIPIGKATVVVVVRTLLSIIFLYLCLPFVFYYDPHVLPWIPKEMLIIVSIIIVIGGLGLIALFKTNLPKYLIIWATKKINHNKRRWIFSLYRDIHGAVIMMSSAPLGMLRVFIESIVNLLFLYSVVPILFMGLGVPVDWQILMGRMILLNIILYFAPTPGGSGIAEGVFIVLFGSLLPSGTVGIVAVAWRAFVEYLPFIAGLYFTIKVFGKDYLNNQFSKNKQ